MINKNNKINDIRDIWKIFVFHIVDYFNFILDFYF